MAGAPTVAQIRALREKLTGAAVIGIHSPSPWQGPPSLLARGERLPVQQCDSPLELREALLAHEQQGASLVIVTRLRDSDLEADVRARLARGRLLTVKSWDVVRDVLRVRAIDPRLTDEAIANALLDLPGLAERPVPSGFLDADTAWDLVAEGLELRSGRPDVLELLRWTQEGGLEVLQATGSDLREALRRRVRECSGAAGEALIECALSEGGSDALALGLVCAVVFHPETAGGSLERAAGRLERYCGNRLLGADAGRAWAQAAETLITDGLAEGGLRQVRSVLVRADSLLREVEAQDQAWLGRFSLLGFEQRLTRLADALGAGLEDGSTEATVGLERAIAGVRSHGLATRQPERVERVEMAARLVRWLQFAAAVPEPGSFEEAASRYASDTGFVDQVRAALDAGDGCPPLSAAYSRLLAAAADLRERENERFGRLLAQWLAGGGVPREVLPVEGVLSAVVSPLAERGPVLLLVVDGMSLPVYRELVEDLSREGWTEIVPEGAPTMRPVLAALPTVTEVSRASLLCGRLCRGHAADEKAGFETHPGLLKHAGRKRPPVLFHKAQLGEGGEAGLATAVRDEVADPDRRVVGLVLNAVDDHLAKGDQIRPRWGIESIRTLRALLHAAMEAGRTVVVTSDHGHVEERGSHAGTVSEAERWRVDDGKPGPQEVQLAGARVVLPQSHRLIAPWSEGLRYGGRKNGYHGGASPQEVVIPMGVFTPGLEVAGWKEIAPAYPAWWTDDAAPAAPQRQPLSARRKPRAALEQAKLPFAAPVGEPTEARQTWVALLVGSPVWKAQVLTAGRVALDGGRVQTALVAFEERGGTLTRQALGHKLGIPPVRVAGFVAALRRLLNVDGYDVLGVDEAADSLTLNVRLLRKQFELPED